MPLSTPSPSTGKRVAGRRDLAIVGILPVGIVLTTSTGRLWPVVVAHGIVDMIGITALSMANR